MHFLAVVMTGCLLAGFAACQLSQPHLFSPFQRCNRQEMAVMYQQVAQCTNSVTGSSNFNDDLLNKTLSGDLQFMCSKLDEILSCSSYGHQMPCLTKPERDYLYTSSKAQYAGLQYLCGNNQANFRAFIESGGLDCADDVDPRKTSACLLQAAGIFYGGNLALEFDDRMCGLTRRSMGCVASLFGHCNSNVRNIISRMIQTIVSETPCSRSTAKYPSSSQPIASFLKALSSAGYQARPSNGAPVILY
ncbi:uncharacterized protein LOC143222613 [Tachypleus tridentatus]|uniref:uncharacterized protein LOC143222613 n=1 Tax=Tachypleus tridentatus TaxID=6853 RepID=UPI003FD5C598